MLPRRFSEVPEIPEGRKYLLVGPNVWGKGKTLEEAVQNCKKQGYNPGKDRTLIYHTDPSSIVDDMGYIHTGYGLEGPVEIHRFK